MKRTAFFILSFLTLTAVFVLNSCGDSSPSQPPPSEETNDSCGSQTLKNRRFNHPDFGGYVPYTYMLGSERYYNFFFEVDSICTDKHVTCDFSAHAFDVPGRPINFVAALEWQIFWERRDTGATTFHPGEREWRARIEDVGLRVPFGDNAASVFVNIYVHFLSLGSAQQDSIFLSEKVTYTSMQLYYNYHKPPADDKVLNRINFKDLTFNFENSNNKGTFDNIFEKDLFSEYWSFVGREKIFFDSRKVNM